MVIDNSRKFQTAVAVVGGTPFDSAKGARYLQKQGIEAVPIAISQKPSIDKDLYHDLGRVHQIFAEKTRGIAFSQIMVYCNSLSFIGHWEKLYPGRVWELTAYYQPILQNAALDELAILVAEPNTVENLKRMVAEENICNPQELHVFECLDLINRLEKSNERQQFRLLEETLEHYKQQGFREILLGCTHLDHPSFSALTGLKVHQPGLVMLGDFIAQYRARFVSKP